MLKNRSVIIGALPILLFTIRYIVLGYASKGPDEGDAVVLIYFTYPFGFIVFLLSFACSLIIHVRHFRKKAVKTHGVNINDVIGLWLASVVPIVGFLSIVADPQKYGMFVPANNILFYYACFLIGVTICSLFYLASSAYLYIKHYGILQRAVHDEDSKELEREFVCRNRQISECPAFEEFEELETGFWKAQWIGKMPLASAFWLVWVVGNLIVSSIAFVAFLFLGDSLETISFGLAIGAVIYYSIFTPYFIFSCVSVWRCAVNVRWRGWTVIARVVVVLAVLRHLQMIMGYD